MIIAAETESFLAPVLIVSIIPVSMSFPVIALWLKGAPITVPILIGLIVISGIIVNNSILIIVNLHDKKELSVDLSELKKPKEFKNIFFNEVKLKEEHPFIRSEFPARSVQIYKLKY